MTNNRTTTKPSLYERAVDYILRMPKTEKQIRQWFARKTDDAAVIEENVERLREHHLIDDEAYAVAYVQGKHDKMGVGMIKNKLRLNGVNPSIIERAVGAIDDQRDLVLANMEKYLRNKERTPQIRAKLVRWLLGKGFNYDVCMEVIDEHWH